MPASFTNVSSVDVGTSPVIVFTATEKSVLIGCNIANTIGQNVTVSLILNDSVDIFVKKNFTIAPGFNDEIMKGNKIVLKVGDKIKAASSSASSVDVILSLITGVS